MMLCLFVYCVMTHKLDAKCFGRMIWTPTFIHTWPEAVNMCGCNPCSRIHLVSLLHVVLQLKCRFQKASKKNGVAELASASKAMTITVSNHAL